MIFTKICLRKIFKYFPLTNLSADVIPSDAAILLEIVVLLWFSYMQAFSKEIGFHLQAYRCTPGTFVSGVQVNDHPIGYFSGKPATISV